MPRADANSWYEATAHRRAEHPALAGAIDCDVCIVGAGYTGLMTALDLAERGFDTVVVEKEQVGWGASGRNGGQIVSGYHPDMAAFEQWVGLEHARRLWAMAEEAKAILIERIRRHQIDCDLRLGYLHAAVRRRHLRAMLAWRAEMAEKYDYRKLHPVGPDQIRGLVDSPTYVGGLLDDGGGQLHPLNYCLGLARAAVSAGVRLFEHSPVVAIESGTRPAALTAHGQVRARTLVLAGNAYLGNTVPALQGWIMPVATSIIATAPLGAERARALIPADVAVADSRFVLDYFRLTPDHRLLFGGGVSYTGITATTQKSRLRLGMLRCFPQLRDVAIDYCWSGQVAITLNRAPHWGRLTPTVWFAHGYSGQGVALTALAGRLIAEAIAGSSERFDLIAKLPHRRFPGGPALRIPLLALAALWYRLRDRV